MNILHVGYFDAANAAWHMSEATKAHTKHDSKTLMLHHTVVAQDADGWLDEAEDRERIFPWADVIVWHVGLKPEDDGRDIYQGQHTAEWFAKKPAVFWINGSKASRDHVHKYSNEYGKTPLVATTPDLCVLYGCEWMPVCVPESLDKGEYTRSRIRPEDRLHVFHAPTDKSIKNTKELEDAVAPILDRVTVHMAQQWPYRRCLAYRSSCDVTFDHMQGYYGASTVEAWALGQPPLVRLSEDCLRFFREACAGFPPHCDVVDVQTLRNTLQDLSRHPAMVQDIGKCCRSWYETCFSNHWKAQRWVQWLEGVVR